MVVIDTRTNTVYSNLSKTEIADMLGVNRITVLRWQKRRSEDQTFKERFNWFEVYFNVHVHRMKRRGMHCV